MDKENDALIKELRRLDAAPPQGLLERCLETVPFPSATPPLMGKVRKRGMVMKPLIVATAAAVTCLLFTLPALRHGKDPLTPAPAFAGTEEAMRHTDRWHMKERTLSGVVQGEFGPGHWFVPNSWGDSETWFDAERGRLWKAYADTETREEAKNVARSSSLELANGELHQRRWNDEAKRDKVAVGENPNHWEDIRAHEIGKVTSADALALNALMRVVAHHLPRRAIAKVKAKHTLLREDADAKGHTFTFQVEQREPENLPFAVPEIRLVIQTDPETKRIQRAEQYIIEKPGATPTLINVKTFEYTDIPAETFNPDAFAHDALVKREP